MPKKKGGKNAKRKGDVEDKRELQFKEDGQDYAIIEKMLGNGWLGVVCSDGVKRTAHIRGAFRKRVWMNVGDVILLSLRDFQDEKADVILKYTPDEARLLKSYGELPDGVKVNDQEQEEEDGDIDVEFDIDEI